MKKKLLKSSLISLGINGILFVINLISAFLTEKLLLGINFYGGEYSSSSGFGVVVEKIHSFGIIGEGGGTTTHISLNIIGFIIPFILVFVIVFIIALIIGLFTKKEKKK